ncbi:hypothetical protein PIB30_063153 [Stylosanthes scabra]|uniref:Uncharacterized protein n=1 Tax=Stylosanthes scabra TaxID=79078 RepID=A0ABU6UNJ3_9FABA|nr:hypothetical protein [Stylosanthes scabra]
MRTVIDCAWMLDGATKDRVLALSLASKNERIEKCDRRMLFKRRIFSYGESIRVETEPIRWANLYVKNEFLRTSNRLSRLTSRLTVVARGAFCRRPGYQPSLPGKYERWSSSASSGSVGLGYDNLPGSSS